MKKYLIGLVAVIGSQLLQVGVASAAAPTALVEDVASETAGVQPLDYLTAGQVIDLGSDGSMTVGYLASCVQERIVGGKVTIGTERSEVESGSVDRNTTECDGGQLSLTASQARHSGAVAMRSMDMNSGEPITVFSASPFIALPRGGSVVVKRVDVPGERYRLAVGSASGGRVNLDLAAEKIVLTPGATYMVSVGGTGRVFKVAESAGTGTAALVSRLVPF